MGHGGMRRIVLLLLALGWGWLVQGVYLGLGHEHAAGYLPVAKSYVVAFLATFPFLFGASSVGDHGEEFKYMRWFGLLWLGVQAAVLLILSWMKLFGLIPLLGFVVLLMAELEEPKRPGDAVQPIFWQGPILTVLSLGGLLYWWHYNPLPSDEAMIGHLQAHRAEIEELVQGYRVWEWSAAAPSWYALPEIKALMEKAGVRYVTDIGPVWHPDPYSTEAAKQFHSLLLAGKILNLNPYSSIDVELKNPKRPRGHFANVLLSTGPALIFKELVYFPEVAKIEGENLWFATSVSYVGKELKGFNSKHRIFPSLNDYPDNWKKGECVYRQIDTHWFIYMCVAAT